MDKINISGLKIDALTKPQLLAELLTSVRQNKKIWVTTIYSEFLYVALKGSKILEMLNQSDFAVADGIAIFWAKKFLDIPLTAKGYWGKVLQAAWQIGYSLGAIIFYPSWIKSALPEKIVGADLVWDLAKMAASNHLSIFLLGSRGNTPKATKQKLISKYPNIQISVSNKDPRDETVVTDINKANPDILLVAYGPIKQEKWIEGNLPKLNVKLAMGVGGTFDYIAGKKSAPPKFIRAAGFEWLWRLVTQPYRIGRIINATLGLALALARYKVFANMPYRQNVVSVLLKGKDKILICKRNSNNPTDKNYGFKKKDMLDYWQFPQGGMDKNETVEQTALRECKEEIGTSDVKIFKISSHKYSYLFPNANRSLLANPSRYKGQEQSIVYLKFLGDENSIKIDGVEFISYKWVPLESLPLAVHDHRKPLAKIIQEDLKGLF